MGDKSDDLVRVIQVGGSEPIYLIGYPVVEVLIDDKIVVFEGGEIEIAEPMDATRFEPRFNPAARQPSCKSR